MKRSLCWLRSLKSDTMTSARSKDKRQPVTGRAFTLPAYRRMQLCRSREAGKAVQSVRLPIIIRNRRCVYDSANDSKKNRIPYSSSKDAGCFSGCYCSHSASPTFSHARSGYRYGNSSWPDLSADASTGSARRSVGRTRGRPGSQAQSVLF